MKLVYKGTNIEVKKDDMLTSFRGEEARAVYWKEPTHGEGKISVKWNDEDMFAHEYYVSVFGLEWIQ